MTKLLDDLKRAAEKIGNKTELANAQAQDGEEIPIVVIHHGQYPIIAFDRGGYALLAAWLDIPPEDAEKFAEVHESVKERLFRILRLEMLEGRTGFALDHTQEDPPKLYRIRLEQKIVVNAGSPDFLQRLADGIQELVVVGMRCKQVLGEAFRDMHSAESSSSTFHEGMYR